MSDDFSRSDHSDLRPWSGSRLPEQDWQVVEEAVKFTNYSTSDAVKKKRDAALAALARLREREAQLRVSLDIERDAAIALDAQVAQLEREREAFKVMAAEAAKRLDLAYPTLRDRAEAAEAREVEYHNIQQALKARVQELEGLQTQGVFVRESINERALARVKELEEQAEGMEQAFESMGEELARYRSGAAGPANVVQSSSPPNDNAAPETS